MEYPVSDFQEMIHKALEYAKGLPLAIKILGSTLFGKGVAEWRSVLDREEIIPPYDVIMMLRESFDELDNMSKEMFLDIACFFVGRDVNHVKEILHDCISCSVDIELLIQKSLITIVNQKIQMHGILQAMGREIVRKQCPNQPAKRRRLYLYGDIEYAMEDGIYEVIENVEAIVLDLEEPKGVALRSDALPNMINLRLLIFRNVQFYGNLDNLSSKLRYVSWDQYPFTCLPSSFQSDTLVQLIMPDSNMTQGWEGKMMLPMLRKMNLCGSKSLVKTPDFGGVPNLERLELEGCTGLLQLHPSIAELSKLKSLNLRGCTNLVSITNSLFSLNSLQVLNLAGCSELAYCLNFSPLKSSVEVELLGIWYSPYLEKLLYFLLFVLPEPKRLSGFCLLLYYLLYACL
ncbi:disease resistance protein RPP2B-like [Neltuma alba]|uniref:disease resistance protein RPP2B-like n=1 Tax=Neltuma alba TaxID=207710 RepID=UPI0010A50025|nr:disease resistance protein RPP2B-like [Prosopis alba]